MMKPEKSLPAAGKSVRLLERRQSTEARRMRAPLGDHVLDLLLHAAEGGVHSLPPRAPLDAVVLQVPPQVICKMVSLNWIAIIQGSRSCSYINVQRLELRRPSLLKVPNLRSRRERITEAEGRAFSSLPTALLCLRG